MPRLRGISYALLARCFPSSRSCNSLLLLLSPNRNDVRLLSGRRRRPRLLVREPLSLVIPEYHFVVVDLLDILRPQRNFSSTTRGVDDEIRNRETRRPSAKRLHDLQSLLHGRAEMLATRDLIRHVE